ncbi:hypothetical protein ADL21_37815 [Streptomyces albus subsp. albus]|nr:hypothetical protein ADL21_37815 [Streptomyces albus subsp. albus]
MTTASAALLTAVPPAHASAARPAAAQAGTGTDSDSALDRYYRQRLNRGGCATGPGTPRAATWTGPACSART